LTDSYAKGDTIRIEISSTPKPDRRYVPEGTTHLDSMIKHVGRHIPSLNTLKNKYVSIASEDEIHGRSWEMSCVMASLNLEGLYTGLLDNVTESPLGVEYEFGPVVGLNLKQSTVLISWIELPRLRVFPHA
jgi:hypothetical protein